MRWSIAFLAFVGFLTPLRANPAEEARLQSTADLGSVERQVRALYQAVAPAIVRIAYGKDPEQTLGSGVIVTPHGHVVTTSDATRSVLQDDFLILYLPDGRRVTGTALGWSEEWRVGLMKTTGEGPWPYVALGDTVDVKAGQLCVVLGYPFFLGVDSDQQPALHLASVTRSAVPIWLTSSCDLKSQGSVVFDLEGRIVGVTTKIPTKGDSVHVGVAPIKTYWNDLVAGKNLDHVRLLPSERHVKQSPGTPGRESRAVGDKVRVAAAIEKARPSTVVIGELGFCQKLYENR